MFKKKICQKCGERISDKHRFCPSCGYPLKKGYKNEDWGMLGKHDFEPQDPFSDAFFRGFGGSMLNKMLGNAMRMLEKEMKKELSETDSQPRTNIRLMINGKEVNLNNIKDPQKQKKPVKKNFLSSSFSKENLKKFSKLPKKEPSTNIRRLSDKVIYEIKMNGVKSIKDISIIQLENSIEIKAIAKDKAYSKLIPINLPIINYELSKGNLLLELEAKN